MDRDGIEWKPSGLMVDAYWAHVAGRIWHVLPARREVHPTLAGNYDVLADRDFVTRVATQEEGREVVRRWYEKHVTFLVSRTLEGWR